MRLLFEEEVHYFLACARTFVGYNSPFSPMPQYEHLTDDELVNLADQREDLTEEARSQLEVELKHRNITPEVLVSLSKIRKTEDCQIDTLGLSAHGCGKKLFAKKVHNYNALSGDEDIETTLWAVVFWFPVAPLASYLIRRKRRENWWQRSWQQSEMTVLQRLPLNWGQVITTWIKGLVFALALLLLKVYLS